MLPRSRILAPYRDTAGVDKKLAALESSDEYKRAAKADADMVQKQRKLEGEIYSATDGLSSGDTRADAMQKLAI